MSLILLGILNSQVSGAAAGAYDLLETQILTSSAASVTFTGLDSYTDYKHLQIRMVTRDIRTGTVFSFSRMRMNGDETSSYAAHLLRGTDEAGGFVESFGQSSQSVLNYFDFHPSAGQAADAFAPSIIDILDFSSSSKKTTIRSLHGMNTGERNFVGISSGLYNKTNAITSIEILTPFDGYAVGSRFSLYGVK